MIVKFVTNGAVPSQWVELSQILGNIASIVTALAALIGLVLISMRTLEFQWNSGFRQFYDEFWTDKSIALARQLISYDDEYDKIKDVLQKMADGNWPDNAIAEAQRKVSAYTAEDIVLTEAIDQLCAKLMQIVFLKDSRFLNKRQTYFRQVFLSYWAKAITNRKELECYIQRLWPTLATEIKEEMKSNPA